MVWSLLLSLLPWLLFIRCVFVKSRWLSIPMVGNADHICVHGEMGSDTWCCFTVFIYWGIEMKRIKFQTLAKLGTCMLLILLLVKVFIGEWVYIPSDSMFPTISARSLVWNSKITYGAIFVRQWPFRDGQGSQKAIKKVPQNIDFVGLVFLLSPFGFSSGDPPGARTQDPNIKSVVLYLLS